MRIETIRNSLITARHRLRMRITRLQGKAQQLDQLCAKSARILADCKKDYDAAAARHVKRLSRQEAARDALDKAKADLAEIEQTAERLAM